VVLLSSIEASARELAARSRPSQVWNEAESILAFLLLVYLDPARLGGTKDTRPQHIAVVALASITGRSENAVVMKVQNQRYVLTNGARGLAGKSARDRDVVESYAHHLDDLWVAVETMRLALPGLPGLLRALGYGLGEASAGDLEAPLDEIVRRSAIAQPEGGTSVRREVLARRGQRPFRERVIANYQDQCAVCVLRPATPRSASLFLRAGHIRPWAVANDHQRLDPANGLSLCVVHDRAFEGGLFTLTDALMVVVAPRAAELFKDKASAGKVLDGLRSKIEPSRKDFEKPGADYLAFHRETIFDRAAWAS